MLKDRINLHCRKAPFCKSIHLFDYRNKKILTQSSWFLKICHNQIVFEFYNLFKLIIIIIQNSAQKILNQIKILCLNLMLCDLFIFTLKWIIVLNKYFTSKKPIPKVSHVKTLQNLCKMRYKITIRK